MAITLLTYIGDGSTTDYVVNFTGGYINQSDVKVYVQGETDSAGDKAFRAFTWIDTGNIRLDSSVPSGEVLYIERKTSIDTLAVIFEDGQILDENKLNNSHQQLLNAIQEALTGYFEDGIIGGLDLNNARITKVGTPTSTKDAVNKEYVDAIVPSNAVLVTTATTKANEATAGANTATAKASEASSSATSAASSAAAAAASEANAANTNASNLSEGTLAMARLADGSIITAKYQNGSVTTAIIANGAVGTDQIANDAITALKILNDTITQAQMANNSVGTDELIDNSVNSDKLVDNSVNATILNVSGNGTAGQVLKTDADGSFTWGTVNTLPTSIFTDTTGKYFTRTSGGSLPTNIDSTKVWSLTAQAGGGAMPSGKNHIELPLKISGILAGGGGGGSTYNAGGSDGGDTTFLGITAQGGRGGVTNGSSGYSHLTDTRVNNSTVKSFSLNNRGGSSNNSGHSFVNTQGVFGYPGGQVFFIATLPAGTAYDYVVGGGGSGGSNSNHGSGAAGENGFITINY